MIISSSLPILLSHLPWDFVIFLGRCLRRKSTNSFGGLTQGSLNRILRWTSLLSTIILGWDADSFTTWPLSVITIGWKADSFTTWLLSALTIRRDDKLFVLAENSSKLYYNIRIGRRPYYFGIVGFSSSIFWFVKVVRNIWLVISKLYDMVFFSLNGPIMPSSTWHKKLLVSCRRNI